MENPFKENIYQKRTSHKKYLAKKKQYQEKISAKYEDSDILYTEENENNLIGRINEIKQTVSGKVFYCISSGEILELQAKDKSLQESIVIGDEVIFENGNIIGIKERKNLLARHKGDSDRFSLYKRILQPIASNLDFIVIVASAKNPKFQIGFIERYLILAQSCNIPAIICISKSDLEKISDPILAYYKEKLNIPIIYTSSETGEGFDILQQNLKNKTIVFVGKSGVGKSSIINRILGENTIRTQEVSEKGGQGRHTTTSSKMYEWQKNHL